MSEPTLQKQMNTNVGLMFWLNRYRFFIASASFNLFIFLFSKPNSACSPDAGTDRHAEVPPCRHLKYSPPQFSMADNLPDHFIRTLSWAATPPHAKHHLQPLLPGLSQETGPGHSQILTPFLLLSDENNPKNGHDTDKC